jgi:hypothetical protein
MAGPMTESAEFLDALADLWSLPKPSPHNLLATPEFIRLKHACNAAFPKVGKSGAAFALCNALRSLGLPCLLPPGQTTSPADEAAARLDDAFRANECRRVHLVPMNMASDLSPIAFGAARICRFSADDLGSMLGASRLKRWFPGDRIDLTRLADFQWLVVEERAPLSGEVEERAVPGFFFNPNEDFGRIDPHKERFPPPLMQAMFFLLTAPWEDLVEHQEADWRAFQVPWSHTYDEDLFVRPQIPPSPDTLAWVEHFTEDGEGGTLEELRPLELPIRDDQGNAAEHLSDERWNGVQKAMSSPLFETPVVHFFVRAFLSDGIDEFLAHVTTIEAALGQLSDHKPADHKKIRSTRRVAHRVSALLSDRKFGDDYVKLFDIRSEFVHGRNLAAVSTKMRVLARSLARKVVDALVDVSQSSEASSRELFLKSLLDRGVAMP